jgi:hypothetical protein
MPHRGPTGGPFRADREARLRRRRARLIVATAALGSFVFTLRAWQVSTPRDINLGFGTYLPVLLFLIALLPTKVAARDGPLTQVQIIGLVTALYTGGHVIAVLRGPFFAAIVITWAVGMVWAAITVVRTRPFTEPLFRLGAALLIVTLLVAVTALETSSPGVAPNRGVAFASDIVQPATRGLVMRMTVHPSACSYRPVVFVTITGTRAFWSAVRSRARVPHVALAIPGTVHAVTPIQSDLTDVLPDEPSEDEYRKLEAFARNPPSRRLMAAGQERFTNGYTLFELDVPRWQETREPLQFGIVPNWVAGRSLGTCYVEVPPIGGVSATRAPNAAFRNTFWAGRFLVPTVATLRVEDYQLAANDASPSPATAYGGGYIWRCDAPRRRAEVRRDTPEQYPTLPTRAYEAPPAGDCQTVLTLVGSRAGPLRDLLLVLLGAAASLGATLIVESMLKDGRSTSTA